jgi:hypothetical protein
VVLSSQRIQEHVFVHTLHQNASFDQTMALPLPGGCSNALLWPAVAGQAIPEGVSLRQKVPVGKRRIDITTVLAYTLGEAFIPTCGLW